MASRVQKASRKKAATSESSRLASVEEQLSELSGRVRALEASQGPSTSSPEQSVVSTDGSVAELLRTRAGAPYEKNAVRGSVLYAGSAHVRGRQYLWEVERPLPPLLDLAPESIAQCLSVVASPQRLSLLLELLQGPKSSQELQEALGFTSPGPLYHHLKELVALELVEQPQRTLYQISPRRVVPLLCILSAAQDVARAR